jgi:hypothetical protein
VCMGVWTLVCMGSVGSGAWGAWALLYMEECGFLVCMGWALVCAWGVWALNLHGSRGSSVNGGEWLWCEWVVGSGVHGKVLIWCAWGSVGSRCAWGECGLWCTRRSLSSSVHGGALVCMGSGLWCAWEVWSSVHGECELGCVHERREVALVCMRSAWCMARVCELWCA